jgi:uncharacterized membrane protein YhaH (DUF805 family)
VAPLSKANAAGPLAHWRTKPSTSATLWIGRALRYTPRSTVGASTNLANYLFGFYGRINRAKQWAIILVVLAYEFILGIAFAATIGYGAIGALVEKQEPIRSLINTPQAQTFGIFFVLSYLVMIYIFVAITTKRLHDRNKSAWWLLVFFVLPLVLNIPTFLLALDMFKHFDSFLRAAQSGGPPPRPPSSPLATIGNGAATIISLWAFVELYCLRGTMGDNRFGADPLAGRR